MLHKITGWCAVLLAAMALYPSSITGGLSCIGFYIGVFSLFIAAFASHQGEYRYFNLALLTSLFNILIVNDGTNIFLFEQQSDWSYILAMYGIFAVVSAACIVLLKQEVVLSKFDLFPQR